MRRYLAVFLFFLSSLALYLLGASVGRYVHYITDPLLVPLLQLKARVEKGVEDIWNTYLNLVDVKKENQKLRKEITELYLDRAALRSCLKDYHQLASLLKINNVDYSRHGLVYAHVVAYDPSGMDTFLVLDKGKADGLEEGYIVAYQDLLVGFLDKVYTSSARVRTVYSGDFTLSATVGDTNYPYKGGFPIGELLHVRQEDNLQTGQEVLLRGSDAQTPALRIGVINQVGPPSGQFFRKVYVKPYARIKSIDYVVVIKVRP